MFYDRFYDLCQTAGVTPTQVARDLEMRQSTISMWKKQGTTPKYETIKKLADYFGVSMDYLQGSVNKPYLYVDVQKSARAMGFKPDGSSLPEPRISAALEQLNDAGKEKVADYAEDILPKYRRAETAPQPPTPAPEGKDTTPAAKPTEGPQEGG